MAPQTPRQSKRKCCLIFPLRAGLCVLALFLCLSSAVDIITSLVTRDSWGENSYIQDWQWLKWCAIGVDGLIFTAASVGFTGIITNNHRLVSAWSRLHGVVMLATLARTITLPILMFTHHDRLTDICAQRNPLDASSCSRTITYAAVGTLIIGMMYLGLMAYFYLCVTAYAARLKAREQSYGRLGDDAAVPFGGMEKVGMTAVVPPRPSGGPAVAMPDWATQRDRDASFDSVRLSSDQHVFQDVKPPRPSFDTSSIANGLFSDRIAELKKTVKEIAGADLNNRLLKDPTNGPHNLHVLDVREPYEWNEEKLPYAIYTGRGMLEASMERKFPNIDHDYVVYCASGKRSLLAAESLTRMGYKNVYALEGGIGAWKKAGYSTSQNFRNVSGFN
ncbi:hypothetical protein HKX48_004757 [Thoreauomyces humboldtii]|nr:hypothetical protein HKX48_004757 [Thoreauomyces humboldtii]